MQRSVSEFMTDSTGSQNYTPQEKLRKISFDTTQVDNYIDPIHKKQKQIVEGWGNNKWEFTNQTLHLHSTEKKSNFRIQKIKNGLNDKKSWISPRLSHSSTRKNYIQKLQEKLWQLINIRQKLQTKTNSTEINFLQPTKCGLIAQKTKSTSQSERQKYEHNFMNFSNTKNQASDKFKQRKPHSQLQHYSIFLRQNCSNSQIGQTNRIKASRSLIRSYYTPSSHKTKQVSIISYPVIQERRVIKKKKVRLQQFLNNIKSNENPETERKKTTKQIKRNGAVKLRIYSPIKR